MRVVKSIDKRNSYQKSLDESIRSVHKEYGSALNGFILVAFTDDLDVPMVSIHCELDREYIPEYCKAVVDCALEASLAHEAIEE